MIPGLAARAHPYPAMATSPLILAIFVLTYAGIAAGRVPGLKVDRTGIAVLGAIGMMAFGGLPTDEIIGFIDWPTMLLLFGFFVLSAQLRLSGFFDAVARALARQLEHPKRFLFSLMLATGGLSAFLNHDIVCFAFAPILGTALLRRRIDPVPFLVGLAIASNIGAAATLVGNPQDMLIGQVAGLSFGSYALWALPPVLFALGGAYLVIWRMSRSRLQVLGSVEPSDAVDVTPLDRGHTIKGLVILAIVIVFFFFTPLPRELIALTAAGIHLASAKFRTGELLRLVDWQILVLFMSLFVVTGAFRTTDYGVDAVQWLAQNGMSLKSPVTLTMVTAALSNLINNSAAVMLLVQVADVTQPPDAYVLALANSFGGSFLIVGSVSNIIVAQKARELGIDVSFKSFARLGFPVTVVALGGLLGWVFLSEL